MQTAAGQTPRLSSAPVAGTTDEPRGEIRGRCVSAQTGEGLRGVSVELSSTGASSADHGETSRQAALSAADGSFAFQHLPAGTYRLGAEKSGYRAGRGATQSVTLEVNQIRADLEIKLNRAAVVTGRIADPDGQPVTNARVWAYRLAWQTGRRVLLPADSTTTDDRGVYRLFHLLAARYIIGAAAPPLEHPRNEGDLQMARAFYPSGAGAGEATRLEAQWGQELSEINLVLERRDSFSVSGVIADSEDGGPCGACVVSVSSLDQVAPRVQFGVAADGSYVALGLTPGRYRITAIKPSRGNHIIASRTVQVGGENLRDVHLVVGSGHAVAGRVVFEPPEAAPDKPNLQVAFPLIDGPDDGQMVQVLPDFSFRSDGSSAGTHRVLLRGLPAGSYFKGLRVSGRELPAPEFEVPEQGDVGPLELVVGFDPATLTGQVKLPDSPSEGHRVTAAIVALFPQPNQSGFLNEVFVLADPSGAFKAEGVAPGSYTAFAFPAGGTQEWRDPDLRRPIENYGKSIELKAGQSLTVELPLAPPVGEPQ